MMKVDMWYRDSIRNVDRVDVFFYPEAGQYRGNLYIKGKVVGDYYSDDSVEIERRFRRLFHREVQL